MNSIIKKLTGLIRLLCILSIATMGLAAITGSGDGSGSSSTEYETVSPEFNFAQIDVFYDGTSAVTETCETTTMRSEAEKAGLDNTENMRIVDGNIDTLEVQYLRAFWSSLGPLQTITCVSSIDGSLGGGTIDATTIQLGSSDWMAVDPIPTDAYNAFFSYLQSPDKEFELCVTCRDSNLYNNYTLDYLIKMDLTLTVAYDNVEETPTE